jgi:hypothetical protein
MSDLEDLEREIELVKDRQAHLDMLHMSQSRSLSRIQTLLDLVRFGAETPDPEVELRAYLDRDRIEGSGH